MTTLRQFEQAVSDTTIRGNLKLWTDTFYERITEGKPQNVALEQEGSELLVEIESRRYLTEFLISQDYGNPGGLTRNFATLDNEIYTAEPNYIGAHEILDVNRGFIHLGYGGYAFQTGSGVETNVYAPGITTEFYVQPA
jgi:hypothetical protein